MSAIATSQAMRGFDCNVVLNAKTAQAFADHGYAFVIRYVPRVARRANDLTLEEVSAIRAAGLGLIVVQHVESEIGWTPTPDKGTQYGSVAASECAAIRLAPGTSVFLDLEAVSSDVNDEATIAYCNNWHASVSAAGFAPGLYVGWRCGLAPDQLYRRLKFASFWAAYNLDRDEYPSVRGVQMYQRPARPSDLPIGIGFPIDIDLVSGDALGGFPVMDLPSRVVA